MKRSIFEVSEKPLKFCQRPLITQILERLHRLNLCNLLFNRCNHKEILFKSSLFILWIVVFCFTLIQEAYSFSIDPARIELSIPAGRQKGKTVTIDNSKSNQPLHLKIYVQDIMFLPDGTNDFPPAGSTEWSCANWIKVVPEEVDIAARKTQNMRVTIAVPEQAKGGYYAMLFFESAPTYVEGLGINFRLGAIIDVTVSNTEVRQAKLANIAFVKPKQIEIDIFNEGNVLIRPKGKVKILDAQGRKIRQLDFNTQRLGVLPKTLRKFSQDLDAPLVKGKYSLKPEIDYGTKYLLVGELPFEID